MPAAEVRAVPVLAQGAGELPGKDELVARPAARPEVLGVVTLAEDSAVKNAVCQINLQRKKSLVIGSIAMKAACFYVPKVPRMWSR